MEDKVILFDSNGVKVGETFQRRARQLVNQQRAEWVDDNRKAVRFAPDVEEWEKEATPLAMATTDLKEDERIYALAERRLHERKMFLIHTLGFIPGYFILYLITIGILYSEGFALFTFGAWSMAYAIHSFFFAKTHLRGFRLVDRKERRARKLAIEVDRLKRMGIM